MNEQLQRILFGVVTSFLAPLIGCLGTGCTISLADRGEYGFRQSTEWGFYHEAVDTKATASSQVEAPAILEWVTGEAKPEVEEDIE